MITRLPKPGFLIAAFSMKQILVCACMILPVLVASAKSDEQVREMLLAFLAKLSKSNGDPHPIIGWNSSSFPCQGRWEGITCDDKIHDVKEIVLGGLNLSGVLDARLLCNVKSLSASLLVVDVSSNNISGENLEDIGNCSQLTHLLVSENQFSGIIPESLSYLKNLKVLDVSHNKLSGPLPDEFPDNLTVFLAQDNQFSGAIPSSDYSSLTEFNVSYNNLRGMIPEGANRFNISSFIYNLRLCGPPLSNNCTSVVTTRDSEPATPPSPPPKPGSSGVSSNQILMFSGYIFIGLAILSVLFLCLYKRVKARDEKLDADNRVAAMDDNMTNKPSFSTVELKPGHISKSDLIASAESGPASASSLIVLTSLDANGLRFEDLLRAPAELLGRGKHGSVYKVVCQGIILAVKRIKDWPITSNEFKERMRRLSLVKHPNLLPAIAFYSSREEKLLVYEFQDNGSLFRHIHSHDGRTSQPIFDWSSRVSAAATIANTLAYLHQDLTHDRIPHGNLKSSNILLNSKMEPCISEYGLMIKENQGQHPIPSRDNYKALFQADVYAFGIILLELLTGRTILNDGLDITSWVLAVVREEWTGEVFDRTLIREGASEERMVNMLQVAIRCTDKNPEARPVMREVALAITAIRDDDELSMDVSDLSMSRSFIKP